MSVATSFAESAADVAADVELLSGVARRRQSRQKWRCSSEGG